MSPKPVFDLLRALFPSNAELSIFLTNYPYDGMGDLLDTLPDLTVPRSEFRIAVIEQLQAYGLDKPALFAALIKKFPMRTDLIKEAQKDYAAGAAEDPAKSSELGGPPQDIKADDKELGAQEKIMGERPSFLDVAYLALGYERSKSVAMLRMKFADGWYFGTAFLVTPDTLLTAHHNLWSQGQKAETVEVVFDFERSVDGPDKTGLVVQADPGSFAGDQASDWAMLRIKEPQPVRPLAPLATTAAVKDDRVAIIQHPGGLLKQVALHHNLVIWSDPVKLQYLTDTLPGSSGSPVFDGQWNVVGVHHAGGYLQQTGQKQAVYCNEGTTIKHVLGEITKLGVKW